MLAQTLATGDAFRTEELHSLPSGTMVKSLGTLGWWEVTEVPQVETVSERDQLALKLTSAWFPACGVQYSRDDTPTRGWRRVADYVIANFTSAETAVAEVAPDEAGDYPERIRDCDGDLWKLVSSSGRYSWVGALRDEIHFTNVSLTDLLANHGPISAE